MLGKLRRLVYWLGFRPQPGTVLYSPSRHYLELGKSAIMAWKYESGQFTGIESMAEGYDPPSMSLAPPVTGVKSEDKIDRTVHALRFCPTCGQHLELHPNTGQPACFLHGDFEVTEVRDSVRVEFKITRW